MKQQARIPATHWSETSLAFLLRPMQRFINQEASSGIVLLAATIIALVIANSPLADRYTALLNTYIGITIGPWELKESILHWINDGLMAIFFFVIGLELKREILAGELASPRAAALPIVAAIGGAVVPASIYIALNATGTASRGWAVPTATDIAFAIGCMALLGSRVPFALKIFLTAVAIVDDLIAILVIALFYSGELNLGALGIGFAVLAMLGFVNLFGIRSPLVYIALGGVVWFAFLRSGVHATIAGVLVAFTIPARNRIDAPTFMQRVQEILRYFDEGRSTSSLMLTDEIHQSAVIELEEACEQVQAPLQKLEHSLHGWVSFAIMPIFAFANAGVTLSASGFATETLPVMIGIIAGLVIGKPLGLFIASWIAVRTKLATLPEGVTWQHIFGAGTLAGIGFTMSLFIASLGFGDSELLTSAKISILIASLIAGVVGLLILSRVGARTENQ